MGVSVVIFHIVYAAFVATVGLALVRRARGVSNRPRGLGLWSNWALLNIIWFGILSGTHRFGRPGVAVAVVSLLLAIVGGSCERSAAQQGVAADGASRRR